MSSDLANLEQDYISQTSPQWRKQFGQVFTPPLIARLMMRWITDRVKAGRILDPALGLGIFFRESADFTEIQCDGTPACPGPYQLFGYEIDSSLTQLLNKIVTVRKLPLTYYQEDFLLAETNGSFDGIVCNPPYIHFQDYKHSLALIQEFNQRYGLELNGFSNIYALFLIKALHLLKPGGRAAFIIPPEFLNADYGISIKEWLLRNGALRKLIIFDPTIQLFPGSLTTSAILLFERSENVTVRCQSLDILTIRHLSALEAVERYLQTGETAPMLELQAYPYERLNPQIKWKQYYSNVKVHLHLEANPLLVPFQQFANTRRGIATGANDFFTFSRDDLTHYQIKQEHVTPCLCRAALAQYAIFGKQEFAEVETAGKKAYLLNISSLNDDPALQEYIRLGEAQAIHTGYLTRNRHPWYSTESVRPADLLVKTFGRMGAFFIDNQSKVLHLTCFHGIYLNPTGQQYRKIIFLYLLTNLARKIFDGQKREYGSGLGKFEPNDIKHAKVLDFTQLETLDLAHLYDLYQEYQEIYRSPREELAKWLGQVEKIFSHYW